MTGQIDCEVTPKGVLPPGGTTGQELAKTSNTDFATAWVDDAAAPTLTNSHIFVGNASNVPTDVAMSGDASIANTGAVTVSKSGGVAFGTAAFQPTSAFDAAGAAATAQSNAETYADTGDAATLSTAETYASDASHLTTGTLPNARIVALPNANLANSAITLNTHAVSLGGSLSLTAADVGADVAGAAAAAQAASLPLHGTADAALKWATARALSFTGDATGSGSVDGSAAVATALTLANSGVSAATYGDATHVAQVAVDAKGRITSASSVSITQPLAANPTATASDTAVNGVATTFMRSDGAPAVQKTSSSVFGLAKVDNTTITAASGVISAVNTGTVTSVAMTMPGVLFNASVTGSPITASGTLAPSLATQSANTVLSGPTTGSAATPTFRALVAADIPSLSGSYLPLSGGTLTGSLTETVTGGGGATIMVQGEGSTTLITARYSNTQTAANIFQRKARGTIATPAVPQTNDVIGIMAYQMYDGATFSNAGELEFLCTETSAVDSAHLGTQCRVLACPIGSGSLTEVARLDNETGLSLFGANPVIDQNRVFRPRAYATASVPSVTATGLVHVTDEGGGTCLAYMDGSNTRRASDAQVIVAGGPSARGLLSFFTGRVSYINQDYIHRTFQKLSDAGLLTKLLGLWVHAGIPTSQTDALLNWITPGTRNLAIVGTPTWAQATGFTGDNSTGMLNTGATEATFGASQDNFAIGTYVSTAAGSAKAVIGQNSAAQGRRLYLQSNGSGALVARCNDGTNDNYTPGKYTGLFVLNRNGSTTYNASNDDAAASTITRTSTGVNQTPAFLGTVDTTASEFCNATILFSFVATGLTTADIANLRGIMVDYLMVNLGAVTATVANLPPALNFKGQSFYVPDLGGGAGMLQSDGTNWFRFGMSGYAADSTSTGSETITYLTAAGNVEYTATLTGNTTITLAGTDAKGATVKKGAEFAITRSGLGLFTFAIANGGGGGGTLTTFASATAKAARCVFDGTNWRLMMDSNL